jgi:HSP20 family protein
MAKKSLIKLVTGSYDEDERVDAAEEEEETNEEAPQEEWMESEGNLPVDCFQSGDEIVIRSAIPGVQGQDLDITITSDMVTIRGEREQEERVSVEDFYHQELYWGAFTRQIILPQEIDTDNAKASLKDGILTIRLPKLDRVKTKKLKIS